jgi:hypothetical protein
VSPLIQLLLAAKGSLLVIAGGVFVAILAVLLAFRRSQAIEAQSTRLLVLALEGKADQARIQARTAGAEAAPLLAALGGEMQGPSLNRLLRDLGWVAMLNVWPAALVIHSLSQLSRRDGGDKTAIAAALLVGLAVLLPIATFASATIVQLSRSTARSMRGHCISLLAKSVKVDGDSGKDARAD